MTHQATHANWQLKSKILFKTAKNLLLLYLDSNTEIHSSSLPPTSASPLKIYTPRSFIHSDIAYHIQPEIEKIRMMGVTHTVNELSDACDDPLFKSR